MLDNTSPKDERRRRTRRPQAELATSPATAFAATASPQERVNALLAIGLTVEELSSALGVAENTIRNWADGSAEPRRAADRALDDLRTVVLTLSEHDVESSRAVNWLRSRDREWLGNERPLDLLLQDPLLVLAAAEEPAFAQNLEQTAHSLANRRSAGKGAQQATAIAR